MKNDDEKFELSLNFDDYGANLFIKGENRDDVFLLFSELKDYLLNEVSINKWTPRGVREVFIFLPLFILFIIFAIFITVLFGSQSPNISDESLNNILQNNDINEKINFLIQTESENSSSKLKALNRLSLVIYSIPIIFLLMIFRNSLVKFVLYFFPTDLFLFGKEIDRYKKRLEIRSKLFWIIIIGLIISIVGGLIVNL